MIEDLITVVIPVYNVERYLERCIQSIINQEYKNLQIILVDDGSTDRSGEICDNYENIDNRITVIHKKNGGLSSARNAALDVAYGNYITFVDSDDWLHQKAIMHMYEILKAENADVSAVKFQPAFDGDSLKEKPIIEKYDLYSKTRALKTFLFDYYLSPCACGKLWASKLWTNVRFPNGKLFEDQYTIYKVIEKAELLVLSESSLYYYYKRPGSIGHSTFSSRTYDLYDAVNTECDYICANYPEISETVNIARLFWQVVFINMMLMSNHNDEVLVHKVRVYARRRLVNLIKCEYLSNIRKVQLILFACCMPLYKVFYFFYKARHRYS